jgi:hypothetical protein
MWKISAKVRVNQPTQTGGSRLAACDSFTMISMRGGAAGCIQDRVTRLSNLPLVECCGLWRDMPRAPSAVIFAFVR